MTTAFLNVRALKNSIHDNISAIKQSTTQGSMPDDEAYAKFCEPINAAIKSRGDLFKEMVKSFKSPKSLSQLKLDNSASDSLVLKSGLDYIINRKLSKNPNDTELNAAQELLSNIDFTNFLSKDFIPTIELLEAVKLLTAKTPEALKSFDKLIKKTGLVIDIYNATEQIKSQPNEPINNEEELEEAGKRNQPEIKPDLPSKKADPENFRRRRISMASPTMEKSHKAKISTPEPSGESFHNNVKIMRAVSTVSPAPQNTSKEPKKVNKSTTLPDAIDTPDKFIQQMQDWFNLQATRDSFVNFNPEQGLPVLADKNKWHDYIDLLSSKINEEDRNTRTRFQRAIGQFARLKSIAIFSNHHEKKYAEEKCIRKCHDALLNMENPSVHKVRDAITEYTSISPNRLGGHELLGTKMLDNPTEFSTLAPQTDFKDFAERLIPMRTTETDEMLKLKEESRALLETRLKTIEKTLKRVNNTAASNAAGRG